MRPAGEIGLAILRAAAEAELVVDGARHGATLKELAARAQVGTSDALHTVKNLTRAGKLEPVADRKVPYRNKPVKEYALKQARQREETVDVAGVFALWAAQG